MISEYLILLISGAAPVSECRGAIIYGLSTNMHPAAVFILAVLANIIIIPIIFKILKLARSREWIFRLFKGHIMSKIKKSKEKFEIYEELALLFFVAIPFPVTGAYTAILIAEILDLDRKKSTLVISLGILIAAIVVFTVGKTSLFFIKNPPFL